MDALAILTHPGFLLFLTGVFLLGVGRAAFRAREAAEEGVDPFQRSPPWTRREKKLGAVAFPLLLALPVLILRPLLPLGRESAGLVLATSVLFVFSGAFLSWKQSARRGKRMGRALAEEMGWSDAPRTSRKPFKLLPEERVVGRWRGVRVGLDLREGVSNNSRATHPGWLRVTVALPLSEAQQRQVLAEAEAALKRLSRHPKDEIALRDGALDLRWPLEGREVPGTKFAVRLLASSLEYQGKDVRRLVLRVWSALRPVLERWLPEPQAPGCDLAPTAGPETPAR